METYAPPRMWEMSLLAVLLPSCLCSLMLQLPIEPPHLWWLGDHCCHIQVIKLKWHEQQVRLTDFSLSAESENLRGSCSFPSGAIFPSSTSLTSVPLQIICVCVGTSSGTCTLGFLFLFFLLNLWLNVVRRTGIDCAVPKPDLILKAGADLSATQLVDLTLLDSVGQFCCLK